MKTILITLLVLITLSAQAQQFTLKESESSQPTTETITIAEKQFNGGYSANGSIYIMRVSSKTQKEYRSYLGTRTDLDFETHPIWTNKAQDKWWYFVIGDGGYPKRIYLEKS